MRRIGMRPSLCAIYSSTRTDVFSKIVTVRMATEGTLCVKLTNHVYFCDHNSSESICNAGVHTPKREFECIFSQFRNPRNVSPLSIKQVLDVVVLFHSTIYSLYADWEKNDTDYGRWNGVSTTADSSIVSVIGWWWKWTWTYSNSNGTRVLVKRISGLDFSVQGIERAFKTRCEGEWCFVTLWLVEICARIFAMAFVRFRIKGKPAPNTITNKQAN